MPALHSRIAAFESLAGGACSHAKLNSRDDDGRASSSSPSLIDSPLSAATVAVLQPPVVLTLPKSSPSPSPPNLGRKTSLIDFNDWIDDDKRKTLTGNGLLINLGSSPPKLSPSRKPAPPLPPRKMTSYTSLKSVASSSSSHSSPNQPQAFLYPPRPRPDGVPHAYPPTPLTINTMELLNNANSKHTQGSSISSFHSVSLSSDTDPSTPGSIANYIATYPIDSTDSLSESFEEVSNSFMASPATERNITLDFDKAKANRASNQTILLPSTTIYAPPSPNPPRLPQRPSPPSSTRNSHKPPPLPSRNGKRTSGSSTPRSTPTSPITTPIPSAMIPTTYAIRRAPPPPPSRSSYASDRSSTQSTFSASSSSHSHGSRVLAFNNAPVSLSALTAAVRTKRPTPVPLAARKRYERVFTVNVLQRRKAVEEQRWKKEQAMSNGLLSPDRVPGMSPRGRRRAAGWRGLSVDLITGDPDSVAEQLNSAAAITNGSNEKGKAKDDGGSSDTDEDEDLVKVRASLFGKLPPAKETEEVIGKGERLEGVIVKLVWKRSGLEKKRLADIWSECDPTQIGSLDLEAFVKGMWRIDEELRRAQNQLLISANSPSSLLGMRNRSANSSRTSLPSSKHSSIASNSGRPAAVPLSRQSSVASQRSTLGSRNAAYQKLTGSNAPLPPTSAFGAYGGKGPSRGGGSSNGNTPYGAGYNGHGNNGSGIMRNLGTNNGSSMGQLSVTMPAVVRNILRGS